jgi:hypothetical protein
MYNLLINLLSRQSVPLLFNISINFVHFTRSNAIIIIIIIIIIIAIATGRPRLHSHQSDVLQYLKTSDSTALHSGVRFISKVLFPS